LGKLLKTQDITRLLFIC